MKRSNSVYKTAKNASKLHRRVGALLTHEDSSFKHYDIRQEYHVSKVNKSYSSNREKYDWVVISLQVVIEVHGLQHYKPCCFGGITLDKAKENFRGQQERDEAKKIAAEEAGWTYVIVKYNEKKISLDELTKRIAHAVYEAPRAREVVSVKPKAKLQTRGFQKPPEGYKKQWPKRKLKHQA